MCIRDSDGGAEYGGWTDALDDGTARNNGFNSGDVIETAPMAIEWILREAMGCRDDQIDYASFDVAGNTTNGLLYNGKHWKFFGSITERENARNVLERMCQQCKSRLYKDENDKFSIWVYHQNPTVTYTDYDFGTSHITNLQIYRTPLSDVAQTVRVNYQLDRGSGAYQKQTNVGVTKKYSGSLLNEALDTTETDVAVDDTTDFAVDDWIMIDNEVMSVTAIPANLTISRHNVNSVAATHADNTPIFILDEFSDDGNGTSDQHAPDPDDREEKALESLWRYGQQKEFVIDADFIANDTTAQTLREHWHDYLTSPKWIIEFDTFINVSNLKVNDVIEFNDTDMDALLKLGGTSWNGLKFVVLSIERRGQMDFHVAAEQVPATLKGSFI